MQAASTPKTRSQNVSLVHSTTTSLLVDDERSHLQEALYADCNPVQYLAK